MNENPSRVRIPKWIRMIVPPLIAATVVLTAACSGDDDAQQYQSQPSSQAQQQQQEAAYAAAQQQDEQQQQAMQQEQEEASAQQAEQQQSAAAAAPTSRRGSRSQEVAQQEQAQQAMADEAEQEAQQSSSSSRSQNQQRASEQQQPRRSLPGSTNFEDYATTGWRETADDDTSTFSLDVDRTSYFLALNWVDAGYAIEPASVRAEEWTNAFNYNYELPRVDDSFAVTTDIVEHPLHSDLHLVRIATQAPEFVDNTPLNVTLVLDASGSMREGNRIDIARAAAESIRRGLSDQDRIAVVLFSKLHRRL